MISRNRIAKIIYARIHCERKNNQNNLIQKYLTLQKKQTFNNQNIQIKGVLHVNLKSRLWTATNCKILVVSNLPQNVLGRDILHKVGIHLTASKPTVKTIGLISDTTIEQTVIKCISKIYSHLYTRLGRSRNHMAKSTFKGNFRPRQHKGRRVPLHLLERVEKELENLIEDKQIMRLEKCSHECFISPVIITVKKDKSVKIALDSKELNDTIHKANTKCKA